MTPNQDHSTFMNPKNDDPEETQDSEHDDDRPAVSAIQVDPHGDYKEIEGLDGAGDDEPDLQS